MYFCGIGEVEENSGLVLIEQGEMYTVGKDGVQGIATPLDRKVEFIGYNNKTLCYVKSAMGYPAIYPLPEVAYKAPAEAVLMDLDGTSVHSEEFWMFIIAKTMGHIMQKSDFKLKSEDEPFVSGHSVSEHLQYCIEKYAPDKMVEEAREAYFQIADYEMGEIMKGRGKRGAFTPAPGLKPFLQELKANNIKIGLVTSGLHCKAWPEILSAFQELDMGDPLDFYDAIITAGVAIRKGQAGTLGELAPKPHPWLYAETTRVGLGVDFKNGRVIGLEDSSAGILSLRLAGIQALGITGGNIEKSGVTSLCLGMINQLTDALPWILKK